MEYRLRIKLMSEKGGVISLVAYESESVFPACIRRERFDFISKIEYDADFTDFYDMKVVEDTENCIYYECKVFDLIDVMELINVFVSFTKAWDLRYDCIL